MRRHATQDPHTTSSLTFFLRDVGINNEGPFFRFFATLAAFVPSSEEGFNWS